MKVWIKTIAEHRQVRTDPHPYIFDSVESFGEALKQGRIDVVSAPSDEFVVLEKITPMSGYYSTVVNGSFTENYVLLVRNDGPFRSLLDLRASRLVLLTHPSASLAAIWLDTELLSGGLPVAERFFADIVTTPKLNKAILPVFFGRADACLVTERGFDVAGELNPQVRKALHTLAISPALVPGLGAPRASLDPNAANQFRDAAIHLAETPAGKHLLNLFQCDRFVDISEADFAHTRAFLDRYDRLKAKPQVTAADPDVVTSRDGRSDSGL
jgi:ABC-type phosphate/phosphonate transport system substrate-binding protein